MEPIKLSGRMREIPLGPDGKAIEPGEGEALRSLLREALWTMQYETDGTPERMLTIGRIRDALNQ